MLIFALKPAHDGGIAVLRDNELLFSLEAEKDSFQRYSSLTPTTLLEAARRCDGLPDVIALGGWNKPDPGVGDIGSGYLGDKLLSESGTFFGKPVQFFSSSHERSHIMNALGMAPESDHPLQTVLVWEGAAGSYFLVDRRGRVVKTVPVMSQPGARYAFIFGLADPTFPDRAPEPRLGDSGKLMALAAYADPADADPEIVEVVDQIFKLDTLYPVPKAEFRDSPLYNVGVESPAAKAAAALVTRRIFDSFVRQAEQELPPGTPLRISGGCGLNCDWNGLWRKTSHFSSVFVPPCPNDSGSAIGTAIDALLATTGEYRINWSVYSGLPFDEDVVPDEHRWEARRYSAGEVARVLSARRVVAWVQGRWEIGPRALGNRSLLAEPFHRETKDRLNEIKQREDYRPIAPCCRVEDLGQLFDEDFEDPYMLYFRRVVSPDLGAVTHVDGTARVQTVSRRDNAALHELLSAFAAERGVGILCNTSLNFNGLGFINSMSDLVSYCEARGVDDMVVGDRWYVRRRSGPAR
ncbi:3-hydroxymethylcephem carbamoyltransferase [Plantactinospora sp. S1510]|uniref:3-hydroxymethylcephem carbamoyltransferase n=1 Tax=Plantactinospora alkalitolerans TaxID=2789879 RepID=A0ABS0GTZ2_9ACTN|nr:carbamoyltransferase C-terminal domain-containing protein [Plantactinospora alkalitolerans]MBF9129655.1 3-hydroxymethylcephem carbamoyltransferase [Plantactinospora alkalitolerans]